MKKRLVSALCSLVLAIGLMPSFASAESYWPDPNPPRYISGSVDKPVATVGDTVTISYEIVDPDGVANVGVGISNIDPKDIDPSAGIASAGWASSGDTSSSFRFDVTSSTTSGKRWVTSLAVTDKAGYVTTIYDATYAARMGYANAITADFSGLSFEVSGTQVADPNPPRFISGSVDKAVATIGDVVTISYTIDDPEGISSVSPTLSSIDPKDVKPDGSASAGWSSSTNSAESWQFSVNSNTEPGKRWVVALSVFDKAGYVTTIYDAIYAANKGIRATVTADFSALTFEVVDTGVADPNPPKFVSGSVDKPIATVGDTVTISYDVNDPDGVAGVGLGISDTDPKDAKPNPNLSYASGWAESGGSSSSFHFGVKSSTAPGKRWITSLTVTDKAGYVTTIYDATYAKNMGYTDAATADLSALSFEVVDPSTIPSYKAIEGLGSSYSQGSSEGLTFRFDAPADKLCSVEVDGKQVSPDCYDVRTGSTILTLSSAFLATLEPGNHTVTAFYADGGRASATFSVSQKTSTEEGTSPKTDDNEKVNSTESNKSGASNSTGNNAAALAETGDSAKVPIAIGVLAAALATAAFSRSRAKRAQH